MVNNRQKFKAAVDNAVEPHVATGLMYFWISEGKLKAGTVPVY
jgi:hypothetical protein